MMIEYACYSTKQSVLHQLWILYSMYPSSGQFQISKNIQRYKSIWRCLKVEQFKYLPQSGQRGRKVHELELWRPPLGISLGPVALQSLKYSTSTREEAFQFVFWVQQSLTLGIFKCLPSPPLSVDSFSWLVDFEDSFISWLGKPPRAKSSWPPPLFEQC